jgi:hypothetical protein
MKLSVYIGRGKLTVSSFPRIHLDNALTFFV